MVRGCREEVPAGAAVVGDRAEGGEEVLGVRRRREALEHPFSPPGGPVGVFGSMVESLVPPVLHSWQHAAEGGRRAG
jgi:hypothetical protein